MIQIKLVPELCDNLPAIELEQYAELTDEVELKLDEADKAAALSDKRMTHDEVFAKYKRGI